MNKVFYIALVWTMALLGKTAASQSHSTALTVKMDGYVVNIGGKILFQPCADSSKSIWESLNNTSFALWYFREDLYLEAIDSIGDVITVPGRFENSTQTSQMRVSYFYCSIELDMMLLDTAKFKLYEKPKYALYHNGKEYSLYGFYVDNRLRKIIPKDIKNLRLLYSYYWDKGYTVPKWLDEYIDKVIKAKKN